jgi:hypothetical protein
MTGDFGLFRIPGAEPGKSTDPVMIGSFDSIDSESTLLKVVKHDFNLDGSETVVLERVNQFTNVPFERGIDVILKQLAIANPRMAQEFREAYRPGGWYGREIWENVL